MTTSEDVYEKSNAIREGNRNYAEVGYFTARPAVDFENAHKVFNDGFDRGWQAATTEANKRMAELELQLQNWKDFSKKIQKIDFNDYLKLQASNHDLREAIIKIEFEYDYTLDSDMTNAVTEGVKLARATPAESLQAHNEVIERCAKEFDKHEDEAWIARKIRSLKEVK